MLDTAAAISWVLFVHIACYIGSRKFATDNLPLSKQHQSILIQPRHVFAIITTADVSLLVLIVFQSLPWRQSQDEVILSAVKLDLAFMVLSAWIVVPLLLFHIMWVGHRAHYSSRLEIIAFSAVLGFISFLFAYVGTFLGIPFWSFNFNHMMARIAAMGVFIGSALAGFGSIQFPLSNLKLLFRSVNPEIMKQLERQLISLLRERHQLLIELNQLTQDEQLSLSPDRPGESDKSSSVFDFPPAQSLLASSNDEEENGLNVNPDDEPVHPSTRRPAGRRGDDVKRLRGEIKTLESIATDLVETLTDMKRLHARYIRSKTRQGAALNMVAWIMAGACLYRVATSLINVALQRVADADPATKAADMLLNYVQIEGDVETWAAYFTLVYVGYLVYGTIQTFSAKIMSFVGQTSHRFSPEFLIFSIIEAQTLYFCSCALLLRTNLPQRQREKLRPVFGQDLNFANFSLQFDLIFAISCLLSILIAAVQQKERRWKLRQD